MPFYVLEIENANLRYVTEAETKTDAALIAYRDYIGYNDYDDELEEAGSGNALAEDILQTFNCTEVDRGVVMDYISRRLDGDQYTNILFL